WGRFWIRPAIFREIEPDSLEALFGIEIAWPFPTRDRQMDSIALCGDPHHLRPAPGDRTDISFLLAVFLDDELFGSIDLGDRIGNFKVQNIGGALQPLGMLGAFEDLAGISALAFEHTAGVVQAVAEHMEIGAVPRHEL